MAALVVLSYRAAMSLGPEGEPITRPVFVWLEIAALLTKHSDGGLAASIQRAMDGRRIGDNATVSAKVDEQIWVNAVLRKTCLTVRETRCTPLIWRTPSCTA